MWYNSIIYVWCEYVCIMYGCMISYVYEYGCIYGCMSMYVVCVWYISVICYACTVCVIWYDDLRLIYTCVIWSCVICALWSQDWCCEIYYIYGFWACCTTGILYVVLNTTCNCIRYYVMWILVLYYVVMCVYVDNCVDNFNINVDNFFVAFATLLRTFLKMLCFRAFSHIISCYLLFALVFSLFHYIVIINYIVYTI